LGTAASGRRRHRSTSTGCHGCRESVSPGRHGTTYMVKKTMQDVGSTQYPILTRMNYNEWEVMMKVMLKGLWVAIDSGTNDE
jgi:hypothetical protein